MRSYHDQKPNQSVGGGVPGSQDRNGPAWDLAVGIAAAGVAARVPGGSIQTVDALVRRMAANECDASGLAGTVNERWHMPAT